MLSFLSKKSKENKHLINNETNRKEENDNIKNNIKNKDGEELLINYIIYTRRLKSSEERKKSREHLRDVIKRLLRKELSIDDELEFISRMRFIEKIQKDKFNEPEKIIEYFNEWKK